MKTVASLLVVMSLVVLAASTSFAQGADPKGKGKTELMKAAAEGDLDKVKSLVAAGANLNAKDKNGVTALMDASAAGETECLKALLAAGADMKTTGSGWTALMYAGNADCVAVLVAAGADVNARATHWRETPLMAVASAGHADSVIALVAAGADVDAKDTVNMTALMSAALSNKTECVRALIDAGADVNVRNINGESAFAANPDILAMLNDAKANPVASTPLMRAAREGNAQSIKAIIASGSDVNARNRDGWTALMYASLAGHDHCVGALVAAGAGVNVKNKNGETALLKAVFVSRLTTVKSVANTSDTLVSSPSTFIFNPRSGGIQGWISPVPYIQRNQEVTRQTVLVAPGVGDANCVKALIAAGADLNTKDRDGMTALIESAEQGYQDCLNALIASHADLNVKDRYGDTALIRAVISGNTNCVVALVTAGADVNAKNRVGKSAFAYSNGSADIAAALRAAGAKE